MRRFRLILPLTLAALVLALSVFALPAQYADTFLGGFADKMDALRAAPGPRIILAGGSGAAFAVRGDLLEAELPGFSAVNLGMYADLGSTVPLEAAADDIRAGDIVVFLPEQNRQTLSLFFGAEAMWQAADGRWDILRSVWPAHSRALLGALPYFAGRKALTFFGGEAPSGDGVYARSSFTRRGDIQSDLRARNVMPGGYDINMPISFSYQPDPAFIEWVSRYAEACAAGGVRFFFGFCPMNAAAVDDSDARAYADELAGSLRCPLLGRPEDSVMDPGWFYDTNFHLNGAGAVVFTAELARLLKAELGLPGEVSIRTPQMPAAADAPAIEGDDSDEDCFLYAEDGGGWRITALSEKGAGKTRLTVPSRHEGRPVTGLEPGVFAFGARLERVTLQANLTMLPDGAFDGCVNLREIVLSGVRPSECSVGRDLLRGTDARVLVDPRLIGAYQTDYFWSAYGARIHPLTEEEEDGEAEVLLPSPLPAAGDRLRFDGNGGYLRDDPRAAFLDIPVSASHLRTNTLPDDGTFVRPGYALIAWSLTADGKGEAVAPGSRVRAAAGTVLYARWAQESPAALFRWRLEGDGVTITGYSGGSGQCVIPARLDGLPVRAVAAGAFRGTAVESAVIPSTVREIAPGAFEDCAGLREIYLRDSLLEVSDLSFAGCGNLSTLHVAAATPPVYSVSYYASFADKFDRLCSLKGQRKLVLFSGSSTRYGYDSAMLRAHFPAYEPVNMGVYAYTNALPQFDLILGCAEEGDALLHAPEFDCLNFQTCEHNQLDFHFWAMMEADYGTAARLDLRDYTSVFDSLQAFLRIRRDLPPLTYEDTPNGYNDEGYRVNGPTNNQYGDYILPRPGSKVDVMLKYVRAEYTPAPFTQRRLDSLNEVYRRFLERGVTVLFTYTPRNRASISEDSTPGNRRALDALLREKLCVPVISDLEDSLISGEFFYLIDSHLSTEGVRLHTMRIISALEEWLGDGGGH